MVTSTSASYDAAGEMTCRAPSSSQTCSSTPTGQALSYDALNRLIQWQNAPSSPTSTTYEAYDGAGQRVWQQTSSGGVTTTTSYYGGLEEVSSNGTTTTTTQYFQAGPITAVSVNDTLSYLVHDLLGSVGAALSTTGTLTAASIYGPWGNVLYRTGTMPTAKGFTGQYGDAATGLDYYGARYYDPVAAQFISADTMQGPNRYAYVGGNPETRSDPTGHDPWWQDGSGNSGSGLVQTWQGCASFCTPSYPASSATSSDTGGGLGDFLNGLAHNPLVNFLTGAGDIVNDLHTFGNSQASGWDKFGAAVNLVVNGALDISYFVPGLDFLTLGGKALTRLGGGAIGHGLEGITAHLAEAAGKGVADVLSHLAEVCGANSFSPDTLVATTTGAVAIGTLKVGELVRAYDPKTGKSQAEPVDHVFVNHDPNLLDVTLAPGKNTSQTKPQATPEPHAASETLHTTSEHPFLTTDRGFVDAIQLHIGEQVRQLDGSVGIVVKLRVVAGVAVRYNLTVRDLHTYAVGAGLWVVHNTYCGQLAKVAAFFGEAFANGPDRAITQIWRAVDAAEYSDIAGSGVFRQMNNPSATMKFFAATEEQATRFGQMAFGSKGQAWGITSGWISKATLLNESVVSLTTIHNGI